MEAKGRFEAIDVDKWLGAHSINAPDVRELDDSGAGKMNKGQ